MYVQALREGCTVLESGSISLLLSASFVIKAAESPYSGTLFETESWHNRMNRRRSILCKDLWGLYASKAQVANIKKQKENINFLVENWASEEIKRIRKPEFPIIEEEVMKFLRWLRSQRMPVSMTIIQ